MGWYVSDLYDRPPHCSGPRKKRSSRLLVPSLFRRDCDYALPDLVVGSKFLAFLYSTWKQNSRALDATISRQEIGHCATSTCTVPARLPRCIRLGFSAQAEIISGFLLLAPISRVRDRLERDGPLASLPKRQSRTTQSEALPQTNSHQFHHILGSQLALVQVYERKTFNENDDHQDLNLYLVAVAARRGNVANVLQLVGRPLPVRAGFGVRCWYVLPRQQRLL